MPNNQSFPQPIIIPIGETPSGHPIYRLDEDYTYPWKKDAVEFRFIVKAGFTYDGASVPSDPPPRTSPPFKLDSGPLTCPGKLYQA